jgi:hypothetical protein
MKKTLSHCVGWEDFKSVNSYKVRRQECECGIYFVDCGRWNGSNQTMLGEFGFKSASFPSIWSSYFIDICHVAIIFFNGSDLMLQNQVF